MQCEHYCFWALRTLLLMRKRCPRAMEGGGWGTSYSLMRPVAYRPHTHTHAHTIRQFWSVFILHLFSIFNIPNKVFTLTYALRLSHPLPRWMYSERAPVKYRTSLLVFYDGSEMFFSPLPHKKGRAQSLPSETLGVPLTPV